MSRQEMRERYNYPMLKVESLSKRFGDLKAIDDVSFTIDDGKIFCLIGPNGAGKTTIVKSIAGLFEPDSGRIVINGVDAQKDPRAAKSLIGFIPDDPSVWSVMTGEEFMHFVGILFGVPPNVRAREVKRLLAEFDLQGIEENYFESYSRGNKQKFSILAALLHKPKLLLIDEPIVGLDPLSARKAKELFQAFARAGGSVLLVTHTLSVAEEIADRIGVIKNGKLTAQGTMDELRSLARLERRATLEETYMKLVPDAT
jgi:ABC-2 type transport system ATP-binding protein